MSQNNVPSKAAASQAIINSGLSTQATSILVKNLNTKTLSGAAGPLDVDNPDRFVSDVTTLSLFIVDESWSMLDDRDQVVSEFDENLLAIKGSSQADEILMSLWAFSDRTRLIHSYLTLDIIDGLTDYHPNGNTALYDSILDGLTGLVEYERELKLKGQRVKLNVAALTDGDDNQSKASAADVKVVVEELRRKRENATFTLIPLGNDVDGDVLADMIGFPAPSKFDKTPAGRRRAFGTWSSSVIRTSQTQIGGSTGLFTATP